ncbi:MAG: hypothetical protein C0621_02615 [Desulfuromonas sp.]|nr:MAG: hypothetical protein C0621_02615 [Desulfuromonas sp.]
MHELLTTHGYPALFLVSFLASTLLPLGSEWLLAAMLLDGFAPSGVVTVATFGNSLGALTTYGIGLWGGPFLTQRVLRIDDNARKRAEATFSRYGSWALLFTWLPVVGDPLCLVGGVLRVGFGRFLLLVTVGKFVRYCLVAMVTIEGGKMLF